MYGIKSDVKSYNILFLGVLLSYWEGKQNIKNSAWQDPILTPSEQNNTLQKQPFLIYPKFTAILFAAERKSKNHIISTWPEAEMWECVFTEQSDAVVTKHEHALLCTVEAKQHFNLLNKPSHLKMARY